MEQMVKAELARFYRILLSYTKTVIGGMIMFLVASILWLGLSLVSREAQVLVGILLFFLLLMFLVTGLVPLPIPQKPTDENDWLLNELGLHSRDVAALGSVGALVLALKNVRSRTHSQTKQLDLDFPLRVQITKREEKAHGPGNKVTKAFVMSKQDFGVFLDDVDQLVEIVLSLRKSDMQALPRLRPRLRPRLQTETVQPNDFGSFSPFIFELPARLMESGRARPQLIQLLKENNIKSELCKWTIETGSAPVEAIELTAGYHATDKKET